MVFLLESHLLSAFCIYLQSGLVGWWEFPEWWVPELVLRLWVRGYSKRKSNDYHFQQTCKPTKQSPLKLVTRDQLDPPMCRRQVDETGNAKIIRSITISTMLKFTEYKSIK